MQRPEELFIEKRIEFQRDVVRSQIWQTCLNCEHWQERDIHGNYFGCSKFKAMPPPHVIVHGCKDHLADVPF